MHAAVAIADGRVCSVLAGWQPSLPPVPPNCPWLYDVRARAGLCACPDLPRLCATGCERASGVEGKESNVATEECAMRWGMAV
eukprot:SAG25_NODE_4937_length_727_cov_316.113057_1_plen_83_part_00